MNNIFDKKGPYSLGSKTVTHRNAKVKTIYNVPTYDKLLGNLKEGYNYEVGYVPLGYEHRPDLISNVFYGTPAYWWLLMLVNSISDPNEGFNVSERILIPNIK